MKNRLLKEILYVLPKKTAHKIAYYRRMKKKLNLENPVNLNEKIQYLIVNKYGKREAMLADKQLVKSYIKEIDNEILIPKTYRVYKNAFDIQLEDLPEKFVLKCNHGSGNVFICTSKKDFDLDKAKKELNRAIKFNFAKKHLEYHYSQIERCIIAEEYLDDSKNRNPIDYKFYCFNGHVESILVCSERDQKLRLDDFDLEWNKLDYTYEEFKSDKDIEKPEKLNDMIEIAKKLSKDHPFVRVDLYEINGKIYFGEFTFTPAAGFIHYYKDDALNHLGKFINIKDL